MDLSTVEKRRAMMEPLSDAALATARAYDNARDAFNVAVVDFKRQFQPNRAEILVVMTEAAKVVVDTEIAAKAALEAYRAGMAKLPKAGAT